MPVASRSAAIWLAPTLLLLVACDNGGGSTGPGAVSEGEARALDEAAEMLEERNLPDGALPPTGQEALPTDPVPEPQGEEVPTSE